MFPVKVQPLSMCLFMIFCGTLVPHMGHSTWSTTSDITSFDNDCELRSPIGLVYNL